MTLATMLEWTATFTGIAAAIIVSLNLGTKRTGLGFVIFTVSSVCWIAAAQIQDEAALTTQNVVMFFINIVGIYRYLIVRAPKQQAAGSAGITQTYEAS